MQIVSTLKPRQIDNFSNINPSQCLVTELEDPKGHRHVDFMGHLTTPKQLGDVAILNLAMHLMTHRFAILWDHVQEDQTWISIMQ